MKHLKLSGHRPSPSVQNAKTEIIKCYTCKEEFSSYWNLMNHRKQRHPSNRMCKYFLKNQCVHGSDCWYRHEEPMETDSPAYEKGIEFRCYVCGNVFANRNSLMDHRRNNHPSIVLCSNFTEGKCERSDTECWFKHEYKEAQAKPTHTPSEEQVFQSASPNAAPPDQEQSIMMFLNVVLQKMSKLETMFQQMKE